MRINSTVRVTLLDSVGNTITNNWILLAGEWYRQGLCSTPYRLIYLRVDSKDLAMTKQELINWGLRHGYAHDKYGHMQKTEGESQTRLKLQEISVRFEIRYKIGGSNEWMKRKGGYYSKLTVNDKDQLCGLGR